jgi:hypothetical protein
MSRIYEHLAHFREHFAHLNGHHNGHHRHPRARELVHFHEFALRSSNQLSTTISLSRTLSASSRIIRKRRCRRPLRVQEMIDSARLGRGHPVARVLFLSIKTQLCAQIVRGNRARGSLRLVSKEIACLIDPRPVLHPTLAEPPHDRHVGDPTLRRHS